MAGLNNLMSDTQQTSTTMPAWYDKAQQNIASQAATALGNAPQLSQTTGQQAINTLQGPSNPFTQAQNTLQQISSGAANPWITDTSGNVTPNTATPMGGLFQAERQQLNQLMPNYTAPATAAGIGSGQFGSLRGQTAVDKAKADAFANLNAQQLQAALSNQTTGAQAAANLGTVGGQGINAAMNVGQTQMNAPYQNVANYANLLGSLQAPTTTTSQLQMSPLNQAATLANTLQGTGIAGGLGTLLFGSPAKGATSTTPATAATAGIIPGVTGGLSSLWNNLFSSSSGGGSSGTGNPGAATGTSITGSGSIGDVSSSSPTIPVIGPNGQPTGETQPNPNYDAYANPYATQDQINNQNAIYNDPNYNPMPVSSENI